MLLAARLVYVALGVTTLVLSANVFLEGLRYRGYDPIGIVGLAIGLPLIAAGVLVRRPGTGARVLTWLGVVAILAGPTYLLVVALTSARDAIALALVPLVIAIALAVVMGRGRVATDANPPSAVAGAG